ncbi:hypothetical protein XAB3213_80019 [Xanthomonas citri pv. bilvae]|nr:hypothetical protein XAB3213_80019 [Xanthomonas citri pv. bilvae]
MWRSLMSTFVSPRRAGILPPYLLEHVAQAAPAHARWAGWHAPMRQRQTPRRNRAPRRCSGASTMPSKAPPCLAPWRVTKVPPRPRTWR